MTRCSLAAAYLTSPSLCGKLQTASFLHFYILCGYENDIDTNIGINIESNPNTLNSMKFIITRPADDREEGNVSFRKSGLGYLALFLLLVLHHQYTTNAKWLQSSLVSLGIAYEEKPSFSSWSLTNAYKPIPLIPLDDLTASSNTTCPSPLEYLPNNRGSLTKPNPRKIPYLIHLISKSRCFNSKIYDNLQKWRTLLGPTKEQVAGNGDYPYSLYLHDDDSFNRLFSQNWRLFPDINVTRKCLPDDAEEVADLWRYLILWEYGGIYTGTFLWLLPSMITQQSKDAHLATPCRCLQILRTFRLNSFWARTTLAVRDIQETFLSLNVSRFCFSFTCLSSFSLSSFFSSILLFDTS